MANVADLLTKGSKSAPATVAVAQVAILLLAANPGRKSALFVNSGANTIFIGRDNTVVAATGIPVPAGATFKDDFSQDAWWAIATTGTNNTQVVETS